MGGGFSGLWTAYFLLKLQPDLKIAVVEKEYCGFGASGRNGGWCSPRFPLGPKALKRRFGTEAARATVEATAAMVHEVGAILEEEGIDAEYRTTGILLLARGDHELSAIRSSAASYEELGVDGGRLLSADEAFERVHATRVSGGLALRNGANVQPAKLVRGLARTVERMGCRIFENTAVERVVTGSQPALVTKAGVLAARMAVVGAGEAYMGRMEPFDRQLLPISSMIVVTEPLDDSHWREIGWECGASLSSQAHLTNYLTRTSDGRILYGSRGAYYQFGSRTPNCGTFNDKVMQGIARNLVDWFPTLEDVRITHRWGGYLGVSRDWLPTVHYNADARLGRLQGYAGRGVATSAMSAKTLAHAILNRPSPLLSLPFYRPHAPQWEHEPMRWLGARYIQHGFARIDQAEDAGRPSPIDRPLIEYLARE